MARQRGVLQANGDEGSAEQRYQNYVTETSKRVEAVRASLINESERGLILVGAAFLDEELQALLLSFFRFERSAWIGKNREPQHVKESLELFGTFKPLSSFDAKISLAFSLGLLQGEHKDLMAIKRVRNKFAYNITAASFSSPGVDQLLKNFTSPEPVNRESVTEKILRVGSYIVARVIILDSPVMERIEKYKYMAITAKI